MPRRTLLPVLGLALGLAVAGCGGGDDEAGTPPASGAPGSGAPATGGASAGGSATGEPDGAASPKPAPVPEPDIAPSPEVLAKKLSAAGLGCAALKPGQASGGRKASCPVKGEQTSIEVYRSAAGFDAAQRAVTGGRGCTVTDTMTWLITPRSRAVANDIRAVVGGKVVCA
ncbi:hypothetical protein [Spirillospora sp. NPDC047279]|uniref:hypothetical protein n=1 Tax=Spirillospora sp. NPDC047279 TaxID=3155478 RepID=UPI0033E7E348